MRDENFEQLDQKWDRVDREKNDHHLDSGLGQFGSCGQLLAIINVGVLRLVER